MKQYKNQSVPHVLNPDENNTFEHKMTEMTNENDIIQGETQLTDQGMVCDKVQLWLEVKLFQLI